MEMTVLASFVVVYLGTILGGLPFLSLDRTGIALLGAIALIGVIGRAGAQVVEVGDRDLGQTGKANIAESRKGADQQHPGRRARERIVQAVGLSQ